MISADNLDVLFEALVAHLDRSDGPTFELVVCGGSALLAHGLITRATRDVDVVALRDGPDLLTAQPLPEEIRSASERVAADFGLPPDWINGGPTSLLTFGLPEGCLERVHSKPFGKRLVLHWLARKDLIALKLYALADTGPGRHLSDMEALVPSMDELSWATQWVLTQDDSEGFKTLLGAALRALGVTDASRILG